MGDGGGATDANIRKKKKKGIRKVKCHRVIGQKSIAIPGGTGRMQMPSNVMQPAEQEEEEGAPSTSYVSLYRPPLYFSLSLKLIFLCRPSFFIFYFTLCVWCVVPGISRILRRRRRRRRVYFCQTVANLWV